MTDIIYFLGAPYSGSTLFGLALGQHSEVLNLGEATNIEHDWTPHTLCTCGQTVENCEYWSRVKVQADADTSLDAPILSTAAPWDRFDQRGGLWKIAVMFGAPLRWFWSAEHLRNYAARAQALFDLTAKEAGGARAIVDLSKSGERYMVLKDAGFDPLLVYLYRDPSSLFASSIKRPKKTRRFWGPKVLREAFILRLRLSYNERIFHNTAPGSRARIYFSDFTHDPARSVARVLHLINEKNPEKPDLMMSEFEREIEVNSQHVFVGNRWLFTRDRSEPIIVEALARSTTPADNFTRFERFVLRVAFLGFSGPKHMRV